MELKKYIQEKVFIFQDRDANFDVVDLSKSKFKTVIRIKKNCLTSSDKIKIIQEIKCKNIQNILHSDMYFHENSICIE